MSERAILILGAGTMQIPALQAAKRIGLSRHVVDGNPNALGREECEEFKVIDLKDKDAILSYARNIPNLSAVFTAGTDFSASVAYVTEALGLPGIGHDVALDASIKGRMRRRFAEAGVPSPSFALITKGASIKEQIDAALAEVALPAVVKPVDNMGARGVKRVATPEEALPAVEAALPYARGGTVIFEEWIDGQEYSIDALVYDGKLLVTGVAERHIYFEPYFIELGHTIPAPLEPGSYATLIDTFEAGVRALGIDNGAAKGDVFLRSDGGGAVGEIAARLSGGYMSGWTYPYASGVELTEAGIRLALGEDPRPLLAPSQTRTTAERAFISIPGTVVGLDGADLAGNLPGVRELFIRVSPGDEVAPPKNNVEKCGNLIVTGENREQAVERAQAALRTIHVRLEAGNRRTEEYLFSPAPETTWAVYPELLPEAETKRRAWLDSIADNRTGAGEWANASAAGAPLPAPVGIRDAATEAAERHWTGFTLATAISHLEAIGAIVMEEELSPAAEALFFRALALGGVQGVMYIRDTLISNLPGEAISRWQALLGGRDRRE